MRFRDRADAGRQLAAALWEYEGRFDVIVLTLSRGGVPVAFEIATRLEAPLDVFLVRKVGAPGHPELAMGAVASGGIQVLNADVITDLGLPVEFVQRRADEEMRELGQREALLREHRPPPAIKGKTVIIVDDGLATGASMQAAIGALRRLEPAKIVAAVPVGPRETCNEIRRLADRFVCVTSPVSFHAVGPWYEDFGQVTDDDVRRLLSAAAATRMTGAERRD